MKRVLYILGLSVLLFTLSACGCRHEWQDASCTQAKVCRLCGQRDGAAMGHNWLDATCETPKTCSVCGQTEGAPLEHDWQDATCARPRNCALCGITEGTALDHSWVDADCDTPKTCTLCHATEGVPLGHSWLDATCDTPKTCSICAATDGNAPGHKWTKATCTQAQTCTACGIQGSGPLEHKWVDATCEEPVHCDYCDLKQGQPLGHSWLEATPDAPKTCSVCKATEGYPIYVDDRFIEEDCAFLLGSWKYEKIYTAEELGIPGYEGVYSEYITYIFRPYGQLTKHMETVNPKAFKELLAAQIAADIYAAQAQLGRDAAATEEFWLRTYGMTLYQYAMQVAEDTISEDDLDIVKEGVYYVADGLVYIAPYWEDSFSAWSYLLEEDQLTITSQDTGEVIVLTKVI